MRKILMVLLALAALLSMAACALAADVSPIWVGNIILQDGDYLLQDASAPVRKKPANYDAGYAYYDDSGLTLKDFKIDDAYHYGMNYSAAIYSDHPIRISLLGENEIRSSCSGIVIEGTTDKDDVWIQDLSSLDPGRLEKGTLKIEANHVGIYTDDNLNISVPELRVGSYGNMNFTGDGIVSNSGEIQLWGDTYVNVEAANTAMKAQKGLWVPGTSYARLYSYNGYALVVNDGKLIVNDNGILYAHSQNKKALCLSKKVEYTMGYRIVAEGYKDGTNRSFSVDSAHSFQASLDSFCECKKVVFVEGSPMYSVSVTNGTTRLRYDSEMAYQSVQQYRPGKQVSIRADEAPTGQVFSHWDNVDGLAFDEKYGKDQPSAVFTMPQRNVSPKAVYVSTHTCSTFIQKNDMDYHWQECEDCGAKKFGTYEAHAYVWNHDSSRHWQECSACGWIDVMTISLHWYADSDCICGKAKPITDRVIAPPSITLVPKPDASLTKPIEIVRPESGPSYELDKDKVESVPKYPVTLTKKLEGVAPEDLPDDMMFVFDVYDMKDGKLCSTYTVTKWELMDTCKISLPIFVPLEFRIEERDLDYHGRYNGNLGVKVYGSVDVHPDIPSENGENSPVGSFTFTDPFESGTTPSNPEGDEDEGYEEIIPGPGVGPNLPYGRVRKLEPVSAEIVITNTLTPIEVDLPETGDESDILLWMSLAMTSIAALALVSRKKREA